MALASVGWSTGFCSSALHAELLGPSRGRGRSAWAETMRIGQLGQAVHAAAAVVDDVPADR